jgi:hypothetical protein
MKETKVIFRKFKDNGDIIAIFPDEPWSNGLCASYMHVGQHSGASPNIMHETLPATPDEYATLKRELESIGYSLNVI